MGCRLAFGSAELGRLKLAARAARAILTGWASREGCWFRWPGGPERLQTGQVVALGGDQIAVFSVPACRTGPDQPVEVEISRDAVRCVARWDRPELELTATEGEVVLATPDGTRETYPWPEPTVQMATLRRVLDREITEGPVAQAVGRRDVRRLVQKLPESRASRCAMALGDAYGLELWRDSGGASRRPADARIAQRVARGDPTVVCSVSYGGLWAALRTMSEAEIDITIDTGHVAVELLGRRGTERVLMGTRLL